MRLRLLLPTEALADAEVAKVIAEAEDGSFCLLPRHADFVAALVPGILYVTDTAGRERLFALDRGVLVKAGDTVLVSAMAGLEGESLDTLRREVRERFLELDEQERTARTALARLEAGTLRRFTELEERRHG